MITKDSIRNIIGLSKTNQPKTKIYMIGLESY